MPQTCVNNTTLLFDMNDAVNECLTTLEIQWLKKNDYLVSRSHHVSIAAKCEYFIFSFMCQAQVCLSVLQLHLSPKFITYVIQCNCLLIKNQGITLNLVLVMVHNLPYRYTFCICHLVNTLSKPSTKRYLYLFYSGALSFTARLGN